MLKRLLQSKLLSNTAIYAVANVLNGAIPFLLLPILTRVFTPEEYGLVTLVSAVIAIMGAFTGLSVHGAVSVKYFDKTVNHPQFVGASLMVLAGSTMLILVFLLFAGDTISSWIKLPKQWLFVAAIASAAQFVINIRLVLWQVKEQPIRYGLFQVSQTLFNLGLSLALVFWAIWGWQGRTWGIVLATLIFAVFAFFSMRANALVNFKCNKHYTAQALNFGLPLIPHTLGGFAMAMSDRFILSSALDVQSVGIYSVGVQMGMVIGLLGDAVAKSYGPYLLKLLSDTTKNHTQMIVRHTYIVFLIFLLLAILYSFILPLIYRLLIGEGFSSSLSVAKIASFGYAFQGMYYAIVGIIFFREKTAILSTITLICGGLGILLAIEMVRAMGMIGCAWAMLITWLTFFSVTWFSSNKIYPLPWLTLGFDRHK